MMNKMVNEIQNYAWGSTTALTDLYGIPNPDNRPMAEMWMGAHPSCSSKILINQKLSALSDLIAQDKVAYLGQDIAERFAELPFLFKVLCAGQPLSIQVHPNKAAAEAGFAKEQAASIAINAPERNYKDANHKPELVFALTPFLAMNGFRPLDEIAGLLRSVAQAHPAIMQFIQQPTKSELEKLFALLLTLKDSEKSKAVTVLKNALAENQGQPWDSISYIAQFYPNDAGLFSPLLLNVVLLQPGEAMFLYAETPHAYLHGSALEVMANSDNVLRAGLTPKYIDVPELLKNLRFDSQPASQLLMQPHRDGYSTTYPIPVADFAFSLHDINQATEVISQQSAAIIFCLAGQVVVQKNQENITLKPGESCFIRANESPVNLSGQGKIARVFNQ